MLTAELRTLADDTEALVMSWTAGLLHKLMTIYSEITSMDIDLTKTLAVPLGGWPPEGARKLME